MLICSASGWANPLLDTTQFDLINIPGYDWAYINELRPEMFSQLLRSRRVPKGLLISSGFERSFISAASLPGITGLLVLDLNDGVVQLSHDNIRWLSHFKRHPANYLLARRGVIGVPDELTDTHSDRFVRTSEKLWTAYFHSYGSIKPEMNYWLKPELLNKLMSLASEGRMRAVQVDYTDFNGRLPALIGALNQEQEKVAVINFSNIGEWIYGEYGFRQGSETLRNIFAQFEPVLAKGALLLFSHERAARPFEDEFDYSVDTIKHLMSLSDDDLSAAISPNILPSIISTPRKPHSYFKGDYCKKELTSLE